MVRPRAERQRRRSIDRSFAGAQASAPHEGTEHVADVPGGNLPWGRLAKPEDIAHGVVFLCDPRSDYITGATLSIDGGIVLPYQEMFRIRNRPKTT